MILYLDTSALAKLFIVKPGAESVRAAVAQETAVATHLIAYPEMRATLGSGVEVGFGVFDAKLRDAALVHGLDLATTG